MASLQDSDLAIPKDMETSLSKKMNRPPGGYGKLLIGVGLGVAIALIGSRFVGGSSTAGEEADPAGTVSQISAQTVTVAPVQRQLVAQRLTVTGTVEPADLLAVTPQISGLQIQTVLVDEGDAVAAGQPLVVLDDTDLRTQIQQAQAQIQVAEAQLQQQQANLAQARAQQAQAEVNRQRYQSLASQGAVSSEELDSRSTEAITARESVGVAEANVASATANIRSAQSDLEQLQTQLTRATVVAPADGIVAERPASVGDVSSTASQVVALIQGNQLELLAEVPQAQLSQVQVGAPVTVTSSTDSDVRVDGAVQEIQPLVDPETRTAQIVVRLPGSDRLRPGMFLTAEIQSGQRPGLTIPTTALLPQPDGSVRVYVLGPDQTAMARSVEIGARIPGEEDGDRVEILQGLDRDEQIIVAGASYVQDGDVVTVAE
ncbi:MAG: efflux RND transporter periplasmic adaptor subunit [Cyanobacteria bacterium P01_H01_bin.152]